MYKNLKRNNKVRRISEREKRGRLAVRIINKSFDQNLDIRVGNSAIISTSYNLSLDGKSYKVDKDLVFDDLLRTKAIADASGPKFLSQYYDVPSDANDYNAATAMIHDIQAEWIVNDYAQTPKITVYGQDNNVLTGFDENDMTSVTTARARDFVIETNNIYNLLLANSAFSDIPILDYTVQAGEWDDPNDNDNIIEYDENPFWSWAPATANAIWAFASAASTNVAAVCSFLMSWKQTRILLDLYARKHPLLAGYLKNAKALIELPRFRSVLENIAKLLLTIPVDIDWVDKIVRTSNTVSIKSDDIFSHIVHTYPLILMPQYNVTNGTSTDNYNYTIDFRNSGWNTSSGSNFFISNPGVGYTEVATNLVSTIIFKTSDILTSITNWVNSFYTRCQNMLNATQNLVAMLRPWVTLVRTAEQIGVSKWTGYACPYLEDYTPGYDPNVMNILYHPELSIGTISANGDQQIYIASSRGKIKDELVCPTKLSNIVGEWTYNLPTNNHDTLNDNYPIYAPPWNVNANYDPITGVNNSAPYQLPILALYTYIFVNDMQMNTLSFGVQNLNQAIGTSSMFDVDTYGWAVYTGTFWSYGKNSSINVSNIGNAVFNHPIIYELAKTCGVVALFSITDPNSPQGITAFGTPFIDHRDDFILISVIARNSYFEDQIYFKNRSPFRSFEKDPGNAVMYLS